MTAISVTAAQVGRAQPDKDEVIQVKLGATTTAGQVLNQDTDGTFGIADANGSGNELQPRVVAVEGGVAGSWVSAMKRGWLYGYDVSAMNYDALVYLSDTAGAFDTAAGSTEARCGRIVLLPDSTKAVYVDFDWTTVWS